MDNQVLYDWIFRFNPMDDHWYAAKRDHHGDLFSNIKSENVLKSSSINTLIEIITKTEGNVNNIIVNDSNDSVTFSNASINDISFTSDSTSPPSFN